MKNTLKKSSLVSLIIFTAIIFRCIPNLVGIAYVLLIFLCFFGPRSIISSIFLYWLFSSLNPAIFPDANAYRFIRFIIFFFALILSFNSLSKIDVKKNTNIYFFFIIFVMFVLVHSIFKSPFITISILKVLSSASLFILLLNSWIKIDENQLDELIKNFFWIFIGVSVCSFFIIGSKLGYIRNPRYFQGILDHPQHFSIMLVIFTTMICTGFPYKFYSIKILLAVSIPLLYMLFLTNSRTGILSITFVYLIHLLINPTFDKIRKTYTKSTQAIFFLSLIVSIFTVFIFFQANKYFPIEFISDFITKSSNVENKTLFGSYVESRGIVLNKSIINIENNFWGGNGFGIGSDLDNFFVTRDPIFGIPISAPIEKGNLFIAILEELGVFGFAIFILFLFVCFLNIFKGSFRGLPMFCVIILLNFGEYVFFSTGGAGSLICIFFTASILKKELKI